MYFTDKGCSWHDQWRPCGLERIQDTEKIDQSKSKHYKEPSMSVCHFVALYVSIIIVYFHVILMMTDILL